MTFIGHRTSPAGAKRRAGAARETLSRPRVAAVPGPGMFLAVTP
jgi:hypothetical protein